MPSEQVIELLQQLAVKLGTTMENLWTVLLHEARVEGVMDLFYSVLFLTLTVASGFLFYRALSHEHNYEDKYIDVPPAVSGITCGIAFITFLVFLYHGVIELINPAYFALREILSALQSISKK